MNKPTAAVTNAMSSHIKANNMVLLGVVAPTGSAVPLSP